MEQGPCMVKANGCPRAGRESTWGEDRRNCAHDGGTGVRRDGVGARQEYGGVQRSWGVSSGNARLGKAVFRGAAHPGRGLPFFSGNDL